MEYIPLAGRTIEQVRAELADDPDVHAVDLPATDVFPLGFPYDEAGREQWHLERLEADKLWDGWTDVEGRRWSGWPVGAEVVVAVIDTGVDGGHPDLDGSLVPSGDACHRTDNNLHGTYVAGIIAAERNERDVVGVAPQARILPIKVHFPDDYQKDSDGNFIRDENGRAVRLDPDCHRRVGTITAAVVLAIESGADVINMSFAGAEALAGSEAVLRAAMMRDIVLVAGAGNCGDDRVWTYEGVTAADWYHQGCPKRNAVLYPAGFSGVISVANTRSDNSRAADSSVNHSVGIAAPGDEILSTVPSYTAGTRSPCAAGATCHVVSAGGTSAAAPVISGVVAHMKARYPNASVSEIRQALYATAKTVKFVSPLADPWVLGETGHRTPEYGWGIVQPLDAIGDLESRFFSCDSVLGAGRGLVAYDIDVDIDADGDTVDDDRVDLFDRRDVWVADQDGDAWCRVAPNAAHPSVVTRRPPPSIRSPNPHRESKSVRRLGGGWSSRHLGDARGWRPLAAGDRHRKERIRPGLVHRRSDRLHHHQQLHNIVWTPVGGVRPPTPIAAPTRYGLLTRPVPGIPRI